MADGFVFQPSYYKSIVNLPDKERLAVYDAVCVYGLFGTEPESLPPIAEGYFILMQPTIDASKKRYAASVENGKKGGAPKGNQNARKQPKDNQKTTQIQPKNNLNKDIDNNKDKNNDIDKDSDIDSDNTGETAPRPHGEYNNVLLTDEEMEKLQEQFPDDWKERIDNLSEYIASNGKNYASHYATIRRWAKKDQAEKKQKGSYYYPQNPCNDVRPEDYENDSENPF